MSEKAKNLLLVVLIIGLVSMTVAFATLSQVLNIGGSAKVQKASTSWNVHFQALESGEGNAVSANSYATAGANTITFTNNSTTATLPLATIKAPGGSVTYRFKVTNSGEINAKVSGTPSIVLGAGTLGSGSTAVPDAITQKMSVSMTYDNGNAINANDTLTAGESKIIKVIVTYDSAATTLPSDDANYGNITAAINYVQA